MNDPLQRLRAANPVGADPGAPPIEDVRARIAAGEAVPVRTARRRRRPRAVAPALGAIVVAAVVAGVVLAIGVHSRPASSTPAGGMRGTVSATASGLHGNVGWVSFVRCLRCRSVRTPGQTNWLATTSDGGGSWAVARRHRFLLPPGPGANQDDWTGTAGRHGGGIVATHDGGRAWRTLDVPRAPNLYSVSVAAGEAWAVGSGCPGFCGGGILHGPASGSHLAPTPVTPKHTGDALELVALGAGSAYVYVPLGAIGHEKAWITTNDGRSWQRVAPGCPGYPISGSGNGAMWRPCKPSGGHSEIGVSIDGGRHWTYRTAPFTTGELYAGSGRVAWVETESGNTLRTTDGGRSWHTAWTPPGDARPRSAALSVQSATTATEAVSVTHTENGLQRTNLALYRTSDGGGHWRRTAVPLPER